MKNANSQSNKQLRVRPMTGNPNNMQKPNARSSSLLHQKQSNGGSTQLSKENFNQFISDKYSAIGAPQSAKNQSDGSRYIGSSSNMSRASRNYDSGSQNEFAISREENLRPARNLSDWNSPKHSLYSFSNRNADPHHLNGESPKNPANSNFAQQDPSSRGMHAPKHSQGQANFFQNRPQHPSEDIPHLPMIRGQDKFNSTA